MAEHTNEESVTACPCGWPLPADWWLELKGMDDLDQDEFDSAEEIHLSVTCPWCGTELIAKGDPREPEERH